MKKIFSIVLLSALLGFGGGVLDSPIAEGYWNHGGYWGHGHGHGHGRRKRKFKRFIPRFAMTGTLGLHFVDYYTDLDAPLPPLAFFMSELGGHLWLSPYFSLDLNLGAHLVLNDVSAASWGYVSLKPGFRVRFGWYYLRMAADFAFSSDKDENDPTTVRRRPFLFGFLVGLGLRVPISYRLRFIAEVDYQFLFTDLIYMPFYGQLGLEYIF